MNGFQHLLNRTLSGWSRNTITLIETGPHLTPTISPQFDQTNTDPELDGSIVRPDIVGNPIPIHRTASNYFDINAFAPTPAGAARIGRTCSLLNTLCRLHPRGTAPTEALRLRCLFQRP